MYRGLAKLVGMEELPAGETFKDQLESLKRAWHDYDYFFLHVKGTDAAGEDGDFAWADHTGGGVTSGPLTVANRGADPRIIGVGVMHNF